MPLIQRESVHHRIPSLDGLRAASIVMVLLDHLTFVSNVPQYWFFPMLKPLGRLGVDVFFVISGYLITTLLLREHEKTGTIGLKRFYLRRTLRIFPASMVYITAMALVVHPKGLLLAYTYMVSYAPLDYPWVLGHLWSLSVEEQFYLLWPLALKAGYRWRYAIAVGVVVLAPFLRTLSYHRGLPSAWKYFPTVADSLMMGCLLAFCYPWMRKHLRRVLVNPLVFGLMAVMVFVCDKQEFHLHFALWLRGSVPFFISLFIFGAIERADWWLNNPVVNALGVLSYSLYLWQMAFFQPNRTDWWAKFPTNLLCSLACAVVSYLIVERPFIHLYHRVFSMRRRTAGEVVST